MDNKLKKLINEMCRALKPKQKLPLEIEKTIIDIILKGESITCYQGDILTFEIPESK